MAGLALIHITVQGATLVALTLLAVIQVVSAFALFFLKRGTDQVVAREASLQGKIDRLSGELAQQMREADDERGEDLGRLIDQKLGEHARWFVAAEKRIEANETTVKSIVGQLALAERCASDADHKIEKELRKEMREIELRIDGRLAHIEQVGLTKQEGRDIREALERVKRA